MLSLTGVNQRPYLPLEYQTFNAEHGMPMAGVDAFPLAFKAEPYKKIIQVDAKGVRHSARCKPDKWIFWDELVKVVADAWDAEDVSPIISVEKWAYSDSMSR